MSETKWGLSRHDAIALTSQLLDRGAQKTSIHPCPGPEDEYSVEATFYGPQTFSQLKAIAATMENAGLVPAFSGGIDVIGHIPDYVGEKATDDA